MHDLITERLDRLDADARLILELIADAAPDATFRLLGTASGAAEERLLEALRTLRCASPITEEALLGDVRFGFSHLLHNSVAHPSQTGI